MNESIIIDIETLSTRTDSLVIEIGAIAFNRDTLSETASMLLTPSFFEQLAAGRHVCPQTIAFHRKKKTLPTTLGDMPLRESIFHLRKFIQHHQPQHVWIQGPDFDRPIIESLCQHVGEPLPWEYFRTRDTRTVWDVAFPGIKHDSRPHHAVPDCRATLKDLTAALSLLARTQAA